MRGFRYCDRKCIECGKNLGEPEWPRIDAVYAFCSMRCRDIFYKHDNGRTKEFFRKALENKNDK